VMIERRCGVEDGASMRSLRSAARVRNRSMMVVGGDEGDEGG